MLGKLLNKYTSAAKENSFKGKYLKNLSSSFILNVGSIILTYATNLILTNVTSKAEYGAYVAVNNLAAMVAMFAPMGLHVLVLRQFSEYKNNQQFGFIKGMNHFSSIFIFISSTILALATYFISQHFEIIHGIENQWYLIVGLCSVPFIALMTYHQAVMGSIQHTGKSLLGEKIIRPLLLAIGSFIIFQFAIPTGGDLINLYFIASVLVFFITWRLLQRGLRFEIPGNHPKEYDGVNWLRQGWVFVPLSVLSIINSRIDLQMIGMLMSEKDALDNIALYNVASKAAQGVSLGLIIANYVLGPSAAELFYSNQKERLQNIVTKTARLVCLISLPLILLLIVFGKWMLSWYGEGYEDSYVTMVILLCGQFVNVFAGSVGYLLIVSKNEKYSFIGMGVSVLMNIVLNIVLIKDYGIEGVAIATAVSMAAWNLIMLYYLRKKTGINPLPVNW